MTTVEAWQLIADKLKETSDELIKHLLNLEILMIVLTCLIMKQSMMFLKI